MREYRTVLDNVGGEANRLDIVAEWLLTCLLVFMPLAFGVVHAWSEEVVVVLSGAIMVCFLLRQILCRDRGVIWSWAYIPVGLFILVAVFQLLPLPSHLVSAVSPNTTALKTELLDDLPNADHVLEPMTLSFYPCATAHNLRLVLAVAGVFVVVLNVYRRPDQIKRLLMAIAVVGGIVAAITLAQNVFGNGKIFWFVPTRHGAGRSGPFVNHSNLGQFMNLSIGAALGLLCVKLHEAFGRRRATPASILEYMSCSAARQLWLLMAVMILCAAAVFISLTRGGVISMLVAITFTTLLFVSRRSLRGNGWIMLIMALVAFTLVLYIGFDAVYDRLALLRDFGKSEGGRLQILKDIWVAWGKFPILGTGLGTHSVVYPMFDRSTIVALAAHAENEYAQAAEETGLVGLGLLIIFGIIIWCSYAASIRKINLPIRLAAFGLGFGLLAILVHSLSDFGQHLPANSTLSAIFCALLLVLARHREDARQQYDPARVRGYKALLPCVLLVGALVIGVWSVIGADRARVARSHWEKALALRETLAAKDWNATDVEYESLINLAKAASNAEPDNIEYRHKLNVFRWRSISQVTNPDTGEIVISEDAVPIARDIVEDFHKARVICPTFGPTYSVVGRIERFVLNDNSGAERIRKGFRLAPCSPTACFVAGYLDVAEGKHEDCVAKFERTMQLDGSFFKRVVNIYANHLSRPNLAITAAGDNIGRLDYVAKVLDDMQYYDLAGQARERMKELLEIECSKPDASASSLIVLGRVYKKQQNDEAAIECYRRALLLDYGQIHWRLELARLLAGTGYPRRCARQRHACSCVLR
ncbi:MAG: O-antigen ligase family protein [Planctomycetota bacterium]|jgi:tetratricopeptide (TPR) repeat protein